MQLVSVAVRPDFTIQFRTALKQTTQGLFDMSRIAADVRAEYGYTAYVDWLKDEFGLSRQTGDNLLNIHKNILMSTLNFSIDALEQLAPSVLYMLAAPSTPDSARTEVIALTEAGMPPSVQETREIVTDHRRYDGLTTEIPTDWQPDDDEQKDTPSMTVIQRAQQFSVLVSSKTNEWYTPVHIIGLARRVLGGIDLDPASCAEANAVVQAESYCDQDIDGLSQPWHGRVWLNPPYGKTAGRSNQDIWAEKLITEYEAGRTDAALLLVKAALGYAWFERLWYAYPVCFVRERLYFTPGDDAEDGQAKAATAILYFGAEVARFKDVFRSIGRVILPEE